eukprot:gene12709-14370_t
MDGFSRWEANRLAFFRNSATVQRVAKRRKAAHASGVEEAGRVVLPATFYGSRAAIKTRTENAYNLAAAKGGRPTFFQTYTASFHNEDR